MALIETIIPHMANPIAKIPSKIAYPINEPSTEKASSSVICGSKRLEGSMDVKELHIKKAIYQLLL